MARTATIEKTNTAEVTDQPAQAPRLSDRLYVEVEELQRQIDELPDKIKAHRDLANESLDDKTIVESLQAARELELNTLPALKVRLWHKQKAYLVAHKTDLILMEQELDAGQIAAARDDLSTAQAILDAAKVELAKAERRFKAILETHRGLGIRAKEIEAELQRHENSRPVVK